MIVPGLSPETIDATVDRLLNGFGASSSCRAAADLLGDGAFRKTVANILTEALAVEAEHGRALRHHSEGRQPFGTGPTTPVVVHRAAQTYTVIVKWHPDGTATTIDDKGYTETCSCGGPWPCPNTPAPTDTPNQPKETT